MDCNHCALPANPIGFARHAFSGRFSALESAVMPFHRVVMPNYTMLPERRLQEATTRSAGEGNG
jgi:hypothetical protein